MLVRLLRTNEKDKDIFQYGLRRKHRPLLHSLGRHFPRYFTNRIISDLLYFSLAAAVRCSHRSLLLQPLPRIFAKHNIPEFGFLLKIFASGFSAFELVFMFDSASSEAGFFLGRFFTIGFFTGFFCSEEKLSF